MRKRLRTLKKYRSGKRKIRTCFKFVKETNERGAFF